MSEIKIYVESAYDTLKLDVEQIVNDNKSLIVTENTLTSAEICLKSVSQKRIDIGKLRAAGTTQFEASKKQFQSQVDALLAPLQSVESELKGKVNLYHEPRLWAVAEKQNNKAGYNTYLSKCQLPDFTGKHVVEAIARIKEIEARDLKFAEQFGRLQEKVMSLTMLDKAACIDLLPKFIKVLETPEMYYAPDKVGEARALLNNAILSLPKRIAELEALELAAIEKQKAHDAEVARKAKEEAELKARVLAEMEKEREIREKLAAEQKAAADLLAAENKAAADAAAAAEKIKALEESTRKEQEARINAQKEAVRFAAEQKAAAEKLAAEQKAAADAKAANDKLFTAADVEVGVLNQKIKVFISNNQTLTDAIAKGYKVNLLW